MADTLKVAVVDRSRTLYQGEASQVIMPAADGDLGVLPGHQPLLVVLRAGQVRVDAPGSTGKADSHNFPVEAGFASVDNDTVTVVLERDLAAGAANQAPEPES